MSVYKVWDPDGESEAHASEFAASTPQDAAAFYAEADSDGKKNGIYLRAGHALTVIDGEGRSWSVNLVMEYVPVFYATLVVPTELP